MRKTSHDGGDSTSVTSGTENEFKKSVMKPKKSSLKRKSPNFSNDSDDPVNEPLLQKDKKKTETSLSAKLFTKGKTDTLKEDDKAKLLNDNKGKTTTTAEFCGTTESLLSMKESEATKITTNAVSTIRNYMNTNVFNSHDNAKVTTTTKSSILVEIDGTKQSGYSPTTPLIFTTAKIHTDGKSKHMEPVHVTPVPILSTIEVSMSKAGNVITNEKKICNESSVISPAYSTLQSNNDKDEKVACDNLSTLRSPTSSKETLGLVLVTSANIIPNKNPAQSNSDSNNLPSVTSKLASVITEPKMTTTKDNMYEQTSTKILQPPKISNADCIKNNVTVKSATISSTKSNDIMAKISKTSSVDKPPDKVVSQKLDLNPDNKIKLSNSSNNSVSTANNIKSTNTSKGSSDITNKPNSSSNGNKQLQRQKITTDEPSIVESKMKPNIELADNLSAKKPSSNNVCLPKVIDSTFTKDSDKLPNISANNTQNIKSPISSTAKSTSNITNILTSTKPTVSSVNPPKTISAQVNTSSKSSSIPVSLTSINKTSPLISNTAHPITIDKSSVVVSKSAMPSLISAIKSPEVTSVQTSSLSSKSESVKTPTTSFSTASYVNSKKNTAATKQITPTATSATVKTTVKPTDAVTKTPFTDATTVQITPITSVLNTITKASSITSQVTCNIQPTIKAPITNATTTSATSVSKYNSTSNTTLIQISSNNQTVPSISTPIVSKIPYVTKSEKSSSVNTAATSSATIKSPNNNTSIHVTAKSSTPISKSTASNISATKTSKISSIPNVANASTVVSPTESKVSTIKETSAKIFVQNTATPTEKDKLVSSASNPNEEAKKYPSVGAKAITIKQSATTTDKVLSKLPSVTTASKSPSMTSVGTISTSASTTKPNTMTTPTSANKPVIGNVSSTSVSRPESIKKGGSKSSENNKDGKVSKA